MSKILVTITTNPENVQVGDRIKLRKMPENEFDGEAIAVIREGLDEPDGYVSAFYKTRRPGTVSAGRIYDLFDDEIEGEVVAVGIVAVEIHHLRILFPDDKTKAVFATWMSDGGGQQEYFNSIDNEMEGVSLRINYHGKENKSLPATDPRRYGGKFIEDDTLRVEPIAEE